MKFYCPYCMNPVEPEKPCPSCGKIPGKYQPSSHHFPPGKLLKDRYLIGRSLGEGGFGITYLGFDTNLERRVAIKEYFPTTFVKRETSVALDVTCYTDTARDFYEKGREQFLTEARTMARLESVPGIVRVLDFFPANNTAYIVMEFLAGSTLKEIVEEQGRIPAKVMMEMLAPVLRAMESMHAAGIIHRDISPDNLMQLSDGSVKLMDFGCARDIEGGRTMTVTLKHGFAPVEQYSGHGQGPWSDVYSLCATVYYCLTGRVPPRSVERGDSEQDPLVAPNKYGAALTPAQQEALLKGMAVRARNRWRSVSDLYSALYGKTMQGFPWTPKEETAKVGETEYVAAKRPEIGIPDVEFGSTGAPEKEKEGNSGDGILAGSRNASGMSGMTEYASANVVGQMLENDGVGSTEYAGADAVGRIPGSGEIGSTEYAGANAGNLGIGAWKEEDEEERQKQKRNAFWKKAAALPAAAKAGIGVAACALVLVVVLVALGKGGFLPTAGGRDIADATPTAKPRATQTPKPTPTLVPEKKEGDSPTNGADMEGTPTPEADGKDSPTSEAEPTPTERPKATVTSEPTPEAEPTPTEMATQTPKPTPTEKPRATATLEPTPTERPKATATPKPTERPRATATPEPTPTERPRATATPEPTPTVKPEAGQRFTSKNGDWRCEYYKNPGGELGIKIKDYYGNKSNLIIPSEIDGYQVFEIELILGVGEYVEKLQIPSDIDVSNIWGGDKLTSIDIGDRCSVRGSFQLCPVLEQISVGDDCSFSVTCKNCPVLDKIYVGDRCNSFFITGENFKTVTIGDECVFKRNPYATGIQHPFDECTDLEYVFIGANAIVEDGFNRCPKLTGVMFQSACTIKEDAFYDCPKLLSVEFGSGCQVEDCFLNCDAVSSLIFGSNCSVSGRYGTDESITTLTFKSNCKIGEDCFLGAEGLTTVSFGSGCVIGESAFSSCNNLKVVTFEENCKIQPDAFRFCDKLTKVTLPSGCKYYVDARLELHSSFPETCTVTGGIPCEDLEELK